tara:strand:+ start:14369 stop:14884 length:516 start_codon:yes stop_codon:yes gene_type:complete
MRFLYYFIFILIFGCTSTFDRAERVYICGDHECVDKKEVREYFDNNISIEVYAISSDKNNDENFDLADLNMLEDKLRSKDKINISEKKKNIKNQIKERKKLAKLKMKKVETKKEVIQSKEIAKKQEGIKKREPSKFTFIRICKDMDECDIDKIAKIIMDIGKQKDYPNIAN